MSLSSKLSLRKQLKRARAALADRAMRSQSVFHRLNELDFYNAAKSPALYASFRSEVETGEEIVRLLNSSGSVILPRCFGERLRLFQIQSMDELHSGEFGIPEPNDWVVGNSSRAVQPADVDLFVVPGIGFDRHGNRLGHGKGHYDRLLSEANPNSIKVAICFDCQLVTELPAEPHDIAMDWIVTESETIYNCE